MMEHLLTELKKRDIRLELEGEELRVAARPGALTDELRDQLRKHRAQITRLLRAAAEGQAGPAAPLEHDEAGRSDPFALTELQHAYWLGRDTRIEMGGVATHLYVELDCEGLDLPRANDALVRLIDQHGMLRAVVDPDGRQRILEAVPRYVIETRDCHAMEPAGAEAAALASREALSHEVRSPHQWPLFEVRATRMPQGRTRLHVSLDLLILDAWSIHLFFKGWNALYRDPSIGEPLRITYRDYLVAEQAQRDGPAYREAQAYWEARIDELPPAPELPLRSDAQARRQPRFSRREMRLPADRWDALKRLARQHDVTSSSLLLAAFSEVLARWSAQPHFTVAVTTGHREPRHPDVQRIIGDFTSVVLHEVDRRDAQAGFAAFAAGVQRRMMRDLSHGAYSGVAVRREWARRRLRPLEAVMPVVFSSALARTRDEEVGDLEQFGRKVYSISQTSQVWLDHHVTEQHGDLVLNWDAADAVFQPGVLDAMFESYCELLHRLLDDPVTWASPGGAALPREMRRRREEADRTELALPLEPLHLPIVAQALRSGGATAVIAADETLTYEELLARGTAVAEWLLQREVAPGEPVAVLMRKGWEQVVAVLGTLMAGAAYVPIDADLPVARQQELLAQAGVRRVLTQPGALRPGLPLEPQDVREVRAEQRAVFAQCHPRMPQAALDRLAYVIFTSGTTGVPKGVMIDHRGASNTVLAINRMFEVGPGDAMLGVSSLSFDLSVYDIFGVLAAGGTLVLPDARRGHDPVHWAQLLAAHQVNLWNSAPQLMHMLLDATAGDAASAAGLRAVLLSGDFIPLDLPANLRERGCTGRITSLGGATEASIWSICHEIGEVDPAWVSIPYGRALPNQTVTVLDAQMRPVADHVRGRIHIGGAGLSLGYLGDPDRTAQRFVTHPATGQRLYDTGDLGRYLEDGSIAILGRDDGQVKIRGHRVELGEIESVLRRHPGLAQAVVVARTGAADTKRLLAYVQPEPGAQDVDGEALRDFAARHLPDYMVPASIMVLERLPVSANGKIDYQALPDIALMQVTDRICTAPRDAQEAAIMAVWTRVIPGLEIGVTDNFFELGGDSVLATRLVHELNAALPIGLEMHELFENLTVEALAQQARQRAGSPAAGDGVPDVEPDARGGLLADAATLLADVAAARAAIDRFPAPATAPADEAGAIVVTGATGWVGAHLLVELLRSTTSEIVCLVRGSEGEGRDRLMTRLAQLGLELDDGWQRRIRVLGARLEAPSLGLDAPVWAELAGGARCVFHLAASASLALPYAQLRRHNVEPLHELLLLASARRRKPVHVLSPMTVCRRRVAGELEVHLDECVHPDPQGLLTAYAQSKWVAEQVLWDAAQRGLPVRIYRCSHALPPTAGGAMKDGDTYATVLDVAARIDVLPDWPQARIHGLPVDLLCRHWARDALAAPAQPAVVHLEQPLAPHLTAVVKALLQARGVRKPETLPLGRWLEECLRVAQELPQPQAQLAALLFEQRGGIAGVQNMFTSHRFSTRLFDTVRRDGEPSSMTPPHYWKQAFGGTPAKTRAGRFVQ
jgi:pyochelin synthetase